MFPATERHGADLPSRYRRCPVQGGRADSISGSSRDGTSGEIDAPADILVPSRQCHASVAAELSATSASPLARHTKSRAHNAFCMQHLLRQQALDELLNDLREYRAASPAFRHFWRVVALHNIARFRRDWLIPERAAFEAAVRRQPARRKPHDRHLPRSARGAAPP